MARYHINFVVDIIQINTENELANEGETLPAYQTAMMDVVLDIGPEMEQAPGNRSNYISVRMPSSSASPLPPAYEHHELEPVHPPPEYIHDTESTMPSSTSQSNAREESSTTNALIR